MILDHSHKHACTQIDMFVVRGTEIGDIERIAISHDNSGAGPAWHCQQVGMHLILGACVALSAGMCVCVQPV